MESANLLGLEAISVEMTRPPQLGGEFIADQRRVIADAIEAGE
jgi:hypothetical protein